MAQMYDTAIVAVLIVHLTWILWVIFGAIWTRGRPWWTAFHIASLVWGILVEVSPWPCPLTLTEQLFQRKAGMVPYSGSFLLHYLNNIVYPDISVPVLTVCGVAVCAINLGIYLWRWRESRRRASR